MRLIINDSTSPYFNLALEEHVLEEMDGEFIMLWRSSPSVIIGANQNTAEEIDAEYVRKNGIPVIRRQSGGGAVFHDLGNVNFTIIRGMKGGDFSNYALFTAPVIEFLAALGVRAELSGRNDLVIDGAKFCGNAQAVRRGRIMHHGCILYSADLTPLGRALRPPDDKLESHSVKSVRKRVTNIASHMADPIPVEEFFSRLSLFFMDHIGGMTLYALTREDIAATERLVREKYSTWEWNFGMSPPYNVKRRKRYEFGTVEAVLFVEGGVISDVRLFGDFFGLRDKSELENRMKNVRCDRPSLEAALSGTDVGDYIKGMTAEDLLPLIC
ncbi:MAG: lipoate--protein ligase [Synergistaceae bacterium]|nr:lipoate--protein ligase [Synergistaceae bacterium]